MKVEIGACRAPALWWRGDNFGGQHAAVVDVEDGEGRVLQLNLSEAMDRFKEIDEAGQRRIEAGIGVAMGQD